MKWHPPGFGGSILDDVVMPSFPAPGMNRNAPCWCQSGLKYKKCHRGRSDETPPLIHEINELGRRSFMTGRCLHPHASDATCVGKGAIRSHSIQRGGGLSAIAEAGHVLTSKASFQELERRGGKPSLTRIGLNHASTFPGFCSFHDALLFRPIERGQLEVDKHTAFLFGYRAICLELQRKRASLEFQRLMAQRLDAGLPLLDQYAMQCELLAGRYGVEVALRDLEKAKPDWDRTLLSNDFSGVHYVAMWFDEVLPIAASSAHLPATDFRGSKIQDLWRRDVQGATFSVTSFKGRTLAVFVWLGAAQGPAATFAHSALAIPDHEIASAIINAAFAITENTFVKMSWWDQLSKSLQTHLLDRTLDGVSPQTAMDPQIHNFPVDLSAARITRRLTSAD